MVLNVHGAHVEGIKNFPRAERFATRRDKNSVYKSGSGYYSVYNLRNSWGEYAILHSVCILVKPNTHDNLFWFFLRFWGIVSSINKGLKEN